MNILDISTVRTFVLEKDDKYFNIMVTLEDRSQKYISVGLPCTKEQLAAGFIELAKSLIHDHS